MFLKDKLIKNIKARLNKCCYQNKIFRNRQELQEKFDQALIIWNSSKTRQLAENLLSEQGKLEHFLQDIEQKLACLPFGGDKFAAIPGMISMVRSYVNREYTQLPKGTILAIIGALIYFFNPLDVLPDFVLGAGLLDDAFVVNTCLKWIQSDVEGFRKWQASQSLVAR